MPLQTYQDTAPFAAAIAAATAKKTMPPWFADPCCGDFSNNPSLTPAQIATLAAWAEAHAPSGDPRAAPPAPHWTTGWKIEKPDLVLRMPIAKQLPARGDVPYQYVIIPTGFKQDRWVRMSEIRPSNPMVVHHAVAYIRDPHSAWLRGAPVGRPFSANDLPTPATAPRRHVDHQRHPARLRPRQFTRSMAARLRETRPRWLRYRFANALHDARPRYRGSIERGTSVLAHPACPSAS